SVQQRKERNLGSSESFLEFSESRFCCAIVSGANRSDHKYGARMLLLNQSGKPRIGIALVAVEVHTTHDDQNLEVSLENFALNQRRGEGISIHKPDPVSAGVDFVPVN